MNQCSPERHLCSTFAIQLWYDFISLVEPLYFPVREVWWSLMPLLSLGALVISSWFSPHQVNHCQETMVECCD